MSAVAAERASEEGGEGIAQLVARHRIVVCAGSGGVGKTTTAASLALWGARAGRHAIVLTIDPARRLADSLGIGPIGNTPRRVPDDVLRSLDVAAGGTLTAMMLDQKGSWDELVERHAPTPEARARILENRFYRQLSQSFAGSQEYMAVEQLGELDASGRYDLIVVDTPPTQHALDFLEAPDRLLAFLDRRIVRWFVRPSMSIGWSAFQSMNRTVRFLLRKIEDATGVATLAEVSDFFTSMSSLFDGFEARVARVTELLRDPKTAFLLISGPDEQVLDQVDYLAGQMAARRMPLKGVVMNRVHPLFQSEGLDDESADTIARAVAGPAGRALAALPERHRKDLVGRVAANFVAHQARARGDALRIEVFRQGLPEGVPVVQVPELARDIHDVHGLAALHPYLMAGE
ncbi:MAG TPA: ArsA-related P-loop ATPase [Candidatus Binatia bacterium]|nr:ArsA-related P-loop ATPase [Candidatus Binatia bacterium]